MVGSVWGLGALTAPMGAQHPITGSGWIPHLRTGWGRERATGSGGGNPTLMRGAPAPARGNDPRGTEREAPKMGAGEGEAPHYRHRRRAGGPPARQRGGDPAERGGCVRHTRARGRGQPPTPTGLRGPCRRHSPRSSWPPSCPGAWRCARSRPPRPSRRSPGPLPGPDGGPGGGSCGRCPVPTSAPGAAVRAGGRGARRES